MITPRYIRALSAYNAEMNRRVYAAAGRLSDADRKLDRGAFFGSIHGTLNHLLWADANWMSRFASWPKPDGKPEQGNAISGEFSEMQARRVRMDADICGWAASVSDEWLAGELTWFSGIEQREMTAPMTHLVIHMFNHQTHHRGQVHALLTAAGEDPGGTDIAFIMPPSAWV